MIESIAVIGAGTMGAGIAQLAAQQGYSVLLYDVQEAFVERGIGSIRSILAGRVERGKLRADEMEDTLRRITPTTNREDVARYDLIIEAAPEDIQLKREIFAALSYSAPQAILATNTSSLSVTSIAAAAEAPERVVGLHFFNPAPVMPLVEVIAGHRTSPETVAEVIGLARKLGKTPVRAADMPGFIVNRVARPFYGEALKILGESTASIEQIDAAMSAAGFRMGPFELMDFIGIDINFAVTKSVYEAFFQEPRYRPHPIQRRMVEAGTLGRKAGSGFYSYKDGEKGEPTLRPIASLHHKRQNSVIPQQLIYDFLRKGGMDRATESDLEGELITRILAMIINEAAFAVGEGVASVRDVDTAMQLGTNYPQGPLRWADEIGLDTVYAVLKSLQENLGEERYRPAPLLWQMVASGIVGDVVGEGFHHPGEKGMV